MCLPDETVIKGSNVGSEAATLATHCQVIGMQQRCTPLNRRHAPLKRVRDLIAVRADLATSQLPEH